MSDSGEFQYVESNYRGKIYHVRCQGAVIPICLNHRENVFGNPRPMFGSSQTLCQGILHSTTSATGAVPVEVSTGHTVARGGERNGRTTAIPRSERRPSTMNSFQCKFHRILWLDSRLQISELQTPSSFLQWKIKFKTRLSSCSQFLTEALLWIKEVEMVDSVDDLMSLSSVRGIQMPNFEVFDAKILLALNRIIHNSHFRKKNQSGGTESSERESVSIMIYEQIRVTGAHVTVLSHADLLSIDFRNDDFQDFDTRWDEFLLSMTKIASDDVLESLYKLRICSLINSKNV